MRRTGIEHSTLDEDASIRGSIRGTARGLAGFCGSAHQTRIPIGIYELDEAFYHGSRLDEGLRKLQ